ncbi:MAG: FkbM family methyltransferase [Planctomycetaceae bacterium]|nr:FkbM family methyltransferase [Planctomycetaceae bacterium]
MAIKDGIRSLAHKLCYDITARNLLRSYNIRRSTFLRDTGITVILDVGANTGQYGQRIWKDGFSGRIISFEPMSTEFQLLSESAEKHPRWEVRQTALGDEAGTGEIQVTDFSPASSLLKPTGLLETDLWHPQKSETIQIQRLDDIADEILTPDDRVCLKLDVQGFEDRVLKGAAQSLSRVEMLELELSVQEMYAGEMLLIDMLHWMDELGFMLVSVDDAYVCPQTGRVLQYDGIFLRKQADTVDHPASKE